MKDELTEKANDYIDFFCRKIPGRVTGTEGNRLATTMFHDKVESLGLKTESMDFECMAWECSGSSLAAGDVEFIHMPGPFSLSCNITALLCAAGTIGELEKTDARGKILLLHGELVKEQLIPESFPYYNPPEHAEIRRLLGESEAAAVISATSRNPELAGGVYPFPFIEDGDFNIPNVYMKDTEGEKLKAYTGSNVTLVIDSKRSASTGCNVIASIPGAEQGKIIVCAHIDSKPGTQGAIDNASGVTVLLLLAELLKDFHGRYGLEIVALNGEDYYSIPGQKVYMNKASREFNDIILVINIDGAGYVENGTEYSLYNCPKDIADVFSETMSGYDGIDEGPQWIQSDHGMFVMAGIPSAAITSGHFMDKLSAEITHTEKDHQGIVDCGKLADIAGALRDIVERIV